MLPRALCGFGTTFLKVDMGQESQIERAVCRDLLKEHGIRSAKLTVPTENGWPDRMILIPGGKPFFVEFKAPGEKPRPKQLYIHQMLLGLGYDVETHDNYELAVAAVLKRVKHV